jgi:hypothetical protein
MYNPYILKKESALGYDFEELIAAINERLNQKEKHNVILPAIIDKHYCIALWNCKDLQSPLLKKMNIGIYLSQWPTLESIICFNLFVRNNGRNKMEMGLRGFEMSKFYLDNIIKIMLDISVVIKAIDQFLMSLEPKHRKIAMEFMLNSD